MSDEMDGEGDSSVDSTTIDEQDARDAMVRAAEEALAQGDSDDDGDDPRAAAEKRNARPLNATHEEGDGPPLGEGDEEGEGDAPPPKKKEPEEKPLSKLAKELHAREAKRKVESEAHARLEEAGGIIEQARQVSHALSQREQQVAAREQAVDNFLIEAKRNPMTVLRKMGWTPDQFIEAATREKDPHYQTEVKLETELSKRDQHINKLTNMVERLVAKANGWEQEAQQAHQTNEVQSFFAAIPEDSPVWKDYEDEDDIVYRANKIRRQYKDKTGKLATPAEIAEYMHYEALRKRGVAPAGTAGRGSAKADKTRANGSRALGNSDASERRSSGGRPKHGLEGDEERDALIRAAEAAIADD